MAAADGGQRPRDRAGRMEISLNSIHQFFNSLDPSPFYEKDLDTEAEHYLTSWAQSLPKHIELKLDLYLRERASDDFSESAIARAIFRHFDERARLTQVELNQLFNQGRISLMIGLAALSTFLLTAHLFVATPSNVGTSLLHESFSIAGWVAMWRPMQIYLYDWWPLRERVKLFRRMSHMPVKIRYPDP